jgi:hypothetical protein
MKCTRQFSLICCLVRWNEVMVRGTAGGLALGILAWSETNRTIGAVVATARRLRR